MDAITVAAISLGIATMITSVSSLFSKLSNRKELIELIQKRELINDSSVNNDLITFNDRLTRRVDIQEIKELREKIIETTEKLKALNNKKKL